MTRSEDSETGDLHLERTDHDVQIETEDTTATAVSSDTPLSNLDRSTLFVNRELSWLSFNRRVLGEAQDESNPLLERVKFLAIASTNLDEFFEIRVAGVMEMVDAGLQGESHDGLSATEELESVRNDARKFATAMHETWCDHLLPELVKAGIQFPAIEELDGDQKKWVDSWFLRKVYPILTPLAVDTAHPFPVLLNKSLNIVLLLQDPQKDRRASRMAVVQVPRTLPRILRLPEKDGQRGYVFTADLVRANLHTLFPGTRGAAHQHVPRDARRQPRSRRDGSHRPDELHREGASQASPRRTGATRDRQRRPPGSARPLPARVRHRERGHLLLRRPRQPRPDHGALQPDRETGPEGRSEQAASPMALDVRRRHVRGPPRRRHPAAPSLRLVRDGRGLRAAWLRTIRRCTRSSRRSTAPATRTSWSRR